MAKPRKWDKKRLAQPDFAYMRECAAEVAILLRENLETLDRNFIDGCKALMLCLEKHIPGIDNQRRDREELEEMRAEVRRLEALVERIDSGAGGSYMGEAPPPPEGATAH